MTVATRHSTVFTDDREHHAVSEIDGLLRLNPVLNPRPPPALEKAPNGRHTLKSSERSVRQIQHRVRRIEAQSRRKVMATARLEHLARPIDQVGGRGLLSHRVAKYRVGDGRRSPLPQLSQRDTSLVASANLELVRPIISAWERGEVLPGAEAAEVSHPEVEIVVVGGPEPSSRTGLSDATPGIEAFLSLWEDYRVETEEFRELDDERVLLLGLVRARGKSSGVKIAQRRASVFHVRDGKITRLVMYWDADLALADLGLSPEGDAK